LAVTRRSFLKITGAALGAILVSLGMQNASMRTLNAEKIPGAGHPPGRERGTGLGANAEELAYNNRIDAIDTTKFLAGCSRCGVCIQKCPFNAIKSESIAIPVLTDVSRNKCPGYENCGICAVVCPTDCLNDAFSDFDGEPSIEKPGWLEGPYEGRDRNPSI